MVIQAPPWISINSIFSLHFCVLSCNLVNCSFWKHVIVHQIYMYMSHSHTELNRVKYILIEILFHAKHLNGLTDFNENRFELSRLYLPIQLSLSLSHPQWLIVTDLPVATFMSSVLYFIILIGVHIKLPSNNAQRMDIRSLIDLFFNCVIVCFSRTCIACMCIVREH